MQTVSEDIEQIAVKNPKVIREPAVELAGGSDVEVGGRTPDSSVDHVFVNLLIRVQDNNVQQKKLHKCEHKIGEDEKPKSHPKVLHPLESCVAFAFLHQIVLRKYPEIDNADNLSHEKDEHTQREQNFVLVGVEKVFDISFPSNLNLLLLIFFCDLNRFYFFLA